MATRLTALGYARVFRHPRTGELAVDTDSLRRGGGGFSGVDFGEDYDDFEGDDDYDDDDDFEGDDFGDDYEFDGDDDFEDYEGVLRNARPLVAHPQYPRHTPHTPRPRCGWQTSLRTTKPRQSRHP